MNITGLITPTSLMFLDIRGYTYNIDNSHPNFEKIKGLFKQAQGTNQDYFVTSLLKQMVGLADVAKTIQDNGDGVVTVSGGVVLYNGQQVHGTIVNRILSGLNEGFNMQPYITFLNNLMSNPSKTAIAELYDFMEYGGMGITDDGHILGYKKIRGDYTDCHSGRFDNHPGQRHEMSRGAVDDNRNRTCSTGFHFCSFDYLSQFGTDTANRVVLVKVNPRDVVAIPSDYNNTKARCCAYTVLSELEDYSSNCLRERSVWTNTNIHQPDMSNTVEQEDDENPDWDWASVDEDVFKEDDMDLQDHISILTGDSSEQGPELVEYHMDSRDRTVKIRVHLYRDVEVYTTEDTDLIAKVFEFIKSRAALTGEKQLVKIVRV